MATFPSWNNQRTFVWHTNIPEDGSYDNFIGSITKQPTDLENVNQVNESLKDILEYVGNDTTKFAVLLSRFLDKNYDNYYVPTEQEKEKAILEKSGSKISIERDGKSRDVSAASSGKEQLMRRRASQIAVQSHFTSDSGRRLSQLEKNCYVVDTAKRLADKEEEEDKQLGLDEDDEVEEEVNTKNYKFLPYDPIEGDSIDELLAEQLNVFEIDIDIRPIRAKKKRGKKRGRKAAATKTKTFYRVNKKKYRVRCIHGVLLVKQKGAWIEFIPLLRELCVGLD